MRACGLWWLLDCLGAERVFEPRDEERTGGVVADVRAKGVCKLLQMGFWSPQRLIKETDRFFPARIGDVRSVQIGPR